MGRFFGIESRKKGVVTNAVESSASSCSLPLPLVSFVSCSRGRTLPHTCTQERRAPYLMVR